MADRMTVAISKHTRDAANQARFYTGQSLHRFIDSAIWSHINFVEELFCIGKEKGTGAHHGAAAIKEMTAYEKVARTVADEIALETADFE